ncbi:MAG: Rrf2 family transcriptional regulator [Rhodothermales bacterium]
MASTRYATTLHILILLAAETQQEHTSRSLATRLGTNPVVLRRIISHLAQAGLVHTRRGAGGGVSLATDPDEITLGQVIDLAEADMTFDTHSLPEWPEPDVMAEAALAAIKAQRRELHNALITEMDRVTLQDVMHAATLRADLARLMAQGRSEEEIRSGYRIERGRLVPLPS